MISYSANPPHYYIDSMNYTSHSHSPLRASASQEPDYQYHASSPHNQPGNGAPAHFIANSQPSQSHSDDPLKWRTYTLGAHLHYPFTSAGKPNSPPLNNIYPSPSPAAATSGWSSAPGSIRYSTSPVQVKHEPHPSRAMLRSRSEEASDRAKSCTHCFATTTPLWRKNPDTKEILCNACGLYILEHGLLRPPELIAADMDNDDDEGEPESSRPSGLDGGKECSHCGSRNTSTWRRDRETGEQLCNACGVYLKLRGEKRPLRLKKNKFKPRPSSSSKASSQHMPEVRVFHW